MQSTPDDRRYCLHVSQDVIVPESQYTKSGLLEECRALMVSRLAKIMLSAVHFDYEHRFQADEIQNVITKWMLSAEFEIGHLFTPETAPQALFGKRHVTAQATLQLGSKNVLIGLALQATPAFV